MEQSGWVLLCTVIRMSYAECVYVHRRVAVYSRALSAQERLGRLKRRGRGREEPRVRIAAAAEEAASSSNGYGVPLHSHGLARLVRRFQDWCHALPDRFVVSYFRGRAAKEQLPRHCLWEGRQEDG